MKISPVNNINLNKLYRNSNKNIRFKSNNKTYLPYQAINYPAIYFLGDTSKIKQPKTFTDEFNKILLKDSEKKTPFVDYVNKDFAAKIDKLIKENPKKGIIIGVTGKSASGKSTITQAFADAAQKRGIDVAYVNSDQYFKDTSDLVKKAGSFSNLIKSGYEFDAPSNFRLELLAKHLKELSEGKEIKSPHFIGDGSGRCPLNIQTIEPAKLIIVEGLAAQYPYVEDILDAKVFVDIDENIRLDRFLQRAEWRHPDWTYEQNYRQYKETTKAADKYILPSKEKSDIVLNSAASKDDVHEFIDNLSLSILNIRKSHF